MPPSGSNPRVKFYPVLHLLTGPPGLTRNGGIWKRLKGGLAGVSDPPRLMVQALHFVPYNLSRGAWEDWFNPSRGDNRLVRELSRLFGSNRDIFLDSGGFQLLHSDKIDLSRWGFNLTAEDILRLQSLYQPTRLASLDSPLSPDADASVTRTLTSISIRNAVWLAENISTVPGSPRPYLVIHGRSPDEVGRYFRRLASRLPPGWLHKHDYGLALGSQVPLSGSPDLVVSNVESLMNCMKQSCRADTDLHVFGVGDAIIGLVTRGRFGRDRPLSYDNSTYVQKAFRLKIFDPSKNSYVDLDPTRLPACSCSACSQFGSLGKELLTTILSSPAYSRHVFEQTRWNKSDVLALAALHNLSWWKPRLNLPARRFKRTNSRAAGAASRLSVGYRFPLPEFTPTSPSLLLLPCSRQRPYAASRTHRRVRDFLFSQSLVEGRDYDRVTLSGFFGPVHWTDEESPAIVRYDFPLTRAVSPDHIRRLRILTATVLGVIGKRYTKLAAYLPGGVYQETFAPTLKPFGVSVEAELERLAKSLGPVR